MVPAVAAIFRYASQMGLEGIVSKRVGSRYVSGRTRAWLKTKNPAAAYCRFGHDPPWSGVLTCSAGHGERYDGANNDNTGPHVSGDPTPGFDFSKILQQFKIPGVDFSSILEREHKNIEALAEANRIAFERWQNLVRRQSEILQDSMKRAVEDAKNQTALKNGAELARSAFDTALANMRELAEMATKSQKDAFEVIRKRVEENLNALRGKKPDDTQ